MKQDVGRHFRARGVLPRVGDTAHECHRLPAGMDDDRPCPAAAESVDRSVPWANASAAGVPVYLRVQGVLEADAVRRFVDAAALPLGPPMQPGQSVRPVGPVGLQMQRELSQPLAAGSRLGGPQRVVKR